MSEVEESADANDAAWKTPFRRYVETAVQIDNLVGLTHQGVSMVSRFPELLEILAEDDQDAKEIESAKARADMAKSEIEDDFPVLHGFALMGLWSAFETFVEDLVGAWISEDEDLLSRPEIGKIKISLAKYMTLKDEDKIKYLVDELQRELKVDLKNGATRFEPLLSAIDLGGAIDERVKIAVFETQQIRNLLAHRSGITDRRFVENCPWLKYEVGQEVRVGAEMYQKTLSGLHVYVATILNRCLAAKKLKRSVARCPPGFEGALNFD